jgi:hypothetical protein
METDDLVQSFREFTDDLVDNPYLWSTSVVESYADRAEVEACERRPLLTSSTDTTMCSIAVTSGTALYTKHIAVREVYYAKFVSTATAESYVLAITNIDELTFTDPDWAELDCDPKYLILDDTSVQLVPAPTEDGTLLISISHVPLIAMSTNGLPTINETHHYNLVYWMLHLAFEKRDADTFDAKKALDYYSRFASYFGQAKGVNAMKGVRTVRDDRSRGGWI